MQKTSFVSIDHSMVIFSALRIFLPHNESSPMTSKYAYADIGLDVEMQSIQ